MNPHNLPFTPLSHHEALLRHRLSCSRILKHMTLVDADWRKCLANMFHSVLIIFLIFNLGWLCLGSSQLAQQLFFSCCISTMKLTHCPIGIFQLSLTKNSSTTRMWQKRNLNFLLLHALDMWPFLSKVQGRSAIKFWLQHASFLVCRYQARKQALNKRMCDC